MAVQGPPHTRQHAVLLDGIENLYRHQILTDCSLIIGTHKLPCHRLVLAASSPYFRAMFTMNLLETTQEEIELYDVDAEAMHQILDYLYTGRIDITDDTVQSVFTAASLFEMLDLCTLCSVYMAQELCVENCVTVYQFASFHNCTVLKGFSRAFTVNHFNEVAEVPDILTLSADDLSGLLSDDNLNIDHEERVYECLIRWTQHDLKLRTEHLPTLLKLVRFALMPEEYLRDRVLSDDLIVGNSFCLSTVNAVQLYKATKAIKTNSCQDDTSLDVAISIAPEMQSSMTLRLGMYRRPMMVFVGGSQEEWKRALTCFDPKTKKNYYAIPLHVSFDFKYRIDHHRAVVNEKGDIFLVGGIFYEDHHFDDAGSALREVAVFNEYHKAWTDCAPLQVPRCAHTLVHLDGFLYAIGGKSKYPGGESLASVERYDVSQNNWRFVSPLPQGLCHHGAVVYCGKIYVVGGVTSQGQVTNAFLEYDPSIDTWTSRSCKMRIARSEFGIALIDNTIYIIGGCNTDQKFSSVEMFDFKKSSWRFGEDFPEERKSMATVVYDGCIYICGGVRTLICRMNRAPRIVETKDLWCLDPHGRPPVWYRQVKLVQYANVHACVVTDINTKRVHESEFISR